MNVYDCANELAKAMRESQEYKELKEAKAALEQDPKGKEMAEEFLKLSQEIELATQFQRLTLGLVHAGREFVLHQKFNFYRFTHSSLL